MNTPTPAQVSFYFSVFCGKMGRRQVESHLTKYHRWWSLRDKQGCSPLMRVLITRGFDSQMFSKFLREETEIVQTLAHEDNGGKNLWWHLLRQHGYREEGSGGWVPLLRDHVPLQASSTSGRGIFIDQIKSGNKRQWCGFFPRNGFSRLIYGLPNNNYATWWGCDDDDASICAQWLLGVRNITHRQYTTSLLDNLDTCERNDPQGRATLPMALRGAFLILQAMHGRGNAVIRREQEEGVMVAMNMNTHKRLFHESMNAPRIHHNRFAEVMRHNEEAALQANTRKAKASTAPRRL